MKRNLLLSICAFSAFAVSAQSVATKAPQLPEGLQKVEKQVAKTLQLNNTLYKSPSSSQTFQIKETKGRTVLSPQKTPILAADFQAYYMLPTEALHFGMDAEFQISYPNIILPAGTDVVFQNLSTQGASCSWTLQGSDPEDLFGKGASNHFYTLPEENDSYSTNWPASLMNAELGGWEVSPIVTATSGKNTDSYFYSMGATFKNEDVENGAVYFTAGGFPALTTYDPIISGIYPGFQSADGSVMQFGSGQTNSDGDECIGIMSVYQKPATPLVIQSVSLHAAPVKSGDKKAVTTDDLTLTVYRIDDGEITNEVLAQAKCQSATYNAGTGAYYITFQFVNDADEDVLFTMDQASAIEISGFDNCNIIALVSDNTDLNGHAYGVYPNGLDYISYSWATGQAGYDFNIADFALNLNATYVTLSSGGEEYSLEAPKAGGMAVDNADNKAFLMYSTFPALDPDTDERYIEIASKPDWAEVSVDNSTWGTKDYGCAFAFQVNCSELTSDKGRSGDIVFETLGGIQTRVHLRQGEVTGITSNEAVTAKAVVNGDNIMLTYPESVTNATIVNVAGQTIATYELPANGQFTIPVAAYNKGMYLVKFNNNQTVKVIK